MSFKCKSIVDKYLNPDYGCLMKEPRSLLDVAPVMPLLRIHDAAQAADVVPVARAITAAGLPMVHIALEGPHALTAIERLATGAPDVIVGAGELTDAAQPALARAAGAEFLVAADGTPELCAAMRASELPHLPGVRTDLDAARLLDDGYTDMVLTGGRRVLRSLASFAPSARFAVAGASAADVAGHLAAPNVRCVLADWLAPPAAVQQRDWDRVRRLAAGALTLGSPSVSAVRAL